MILQEGLLEILSKLEIGVSLIDTTAPTSFAISEQALRVSASDGGDDHGREWGSRAGDEEKEKEEKKEDKQTDPLFSLVGTTAIASLVFGQVSLEFLSTFGYSCAILESRVVRLLAKSLCGETTTASSCVAACHFPAGPALTVTVENGKSLQDRQNAQNQNAQNQNAEVEIEIQLIAVRAASSLIASGCNAIATG